MTHPAGLGAYSMPAWSTSRHLVPLEPSLICDLVCNFPFFVCASVRDPLQVGEWQGVLAGFTLGATHLVFYCAYALSLWYGARRVASGALDGGRVISVLMACVLGGFSLGQVGGYACAALVAAL